MKVVLFISAVLLSAASSNVVAQGVLPIAIDGYRSVCLATVPDFSGYRSAARQAGFRGVDGSLVLPEGEARVDMFSTEQGCACLTTLIAPSPEDTAQAVLKVTIDAAQEVAKSPYQGITALLRWDRGDNALQLEHDIRGSVPLIRATLLSNVPCPTR